MLYQYLFKYLTELGLTSETVYKFISVFRGIAVSGVTKR